jgi:hypothetical protein
VVLEVLVTIAFYQPITRPEIETVRGVSLSQAAMDILLETGLMRGAWAQAGIWQPDIVGDDAAVFGPIRPEEPRDLPGSSLTMSLPDFRDREAVPRQGDDASPAAEEETLSDPT